MSKHSKSAPTESNQSIDTVDSLLENIDSLFSEKHGTIELLPITFWLPVDYKEKYDAIQGSTKRKFGKVLKQVLMKSIDKVSI
jgi:hypothetical protein